MITSPTVHMLLTKAKRPAGQSQRSAHITRVLVLVTNATSRTVSWHKVHRTTNQLTASNLRTYIPSRHLNPNVSAIIGIERQQSAVQATPYLSLDRLRVKIARLRQPDELLNRFHQQTSRQHLRGIFLPKSHTTASLNTQP